MRHTRPTPIPRLLSPVRVSGSYTGARGRRRDGVALLGVPFSMHPWSEAGMKKVSAADQAASGRAKGSETTSRRAAIVRKAVSLAVLRYRVDERLPIVRSLELAHKRLLGLQQTSDRGGATHALIRRSASVLTSEMNRLHAGWPAKLTTSVLISWAAADFGGDPEAAFFAELEKP